MIRLVLRDPKLFVPARTENLSLTHRVPIICVSSAVQITQIPISQPLRDVLGKLDTMGSRNGSNLFKVARRFGTDSARHRSGSELRESDDFRRADVRVPRLGTPS